MRKLFLLTFLGVIAFANNLILDQGEIIAHTEVFGDRHIDPKTQDITSTLIMNEEIESIKGEIVIKSISLISDNKDRDENMYELLNIQTHPLISCTIEQVKKKESNYELSGTLTLNGITNKFTSLAIINESAKRVDLTGKFSITLTNFGLKPPVLIFLTVRDQIDINYNLAYTKGK
jgi:polyisoprenoid-binding protein YceI